MEKLNAVESRTASIGRGAAFGESAELEGVYTATCIDADGNVRWTETFENNVTSEGKIYFLNKAMAGSAYTAAWYVGLINSGYTPTGSETYAAKGGNENAAYAAATRPAAVFATATGSTGTGSIAFSAAIAFVINATGTIGGIFLNSGSNVKSDQTASAGVNALLSIGNFSGGARSVLSGDTLNVSYTLSV
jgi:hypothetical protein